MARKEAQLRRLRTRVLAATPLGKDVVAFVEENAADLSGALMEDEDVFGLAVRLIEPWLRLRNNFEILEAEIDSGTVQAFARLSDRLAKVRPSLKEQMAAFEGVISQAEGVTIRDVIRKAHVGKGTAKRRRPGRSRSRPRKRRQDADGMDATRALHAALHGFVSVEAVDASTNRVKERSTRAERADANPSRWASRA
jgi:hypothetical protein